MSNKYSRNKRNKREQNNVILIVCCGETEELYFKEFNIDLGEIKIKPITHSKDPVSIVKHALILKERKKYREVWCVFDYDDYENFDEAIQLCKKSEIRVAFSNQAFEYWFILHYEKANRPIHRDKYKNILSKYMSKPYEKAKSDMYNLLKPNMESAIENAKIIHQIHIRDRGLPSSWESCTTVYKLVEELLKWKR